MIGAAVATLAAGECNAPATLRILMTARAASQVADDVTHALDGAAWTHVLPGDGVDCDIAFVSRDVTGLSTKHEIVAETREFYDAMLASSTLRWVHVHSAGADRAAYVALRERGVDITTSSGANGTIVAHSAIAGMMAIARHLPKMLAAQRERRWTSLMASPLPRDLEGQRAVVVGWGPIGQKTAELLRALGLDVGVARWSAEPAGEGVATVPYARIGELLSSADWVFLCCPLSDQTRGLIDATLLARLPPGANLVNVARGDVVDQAALIDALQSGQLGGAYLDVFEHEPLPASSPLWDMPNVIVTPHSAGLSDGNEARVARMFVEKLRERARDLRR